MLRRSRECRDWRVYRIEKAGKQEASKGGRRSRQASKKQARSKGKGKAGKAGSKQGWKEELNVCMLYFMVITNRSTGWRVCEDKRRGHRVIDKERLV